MSRAAAISNDPVADEVATELLRAGKSALGAALGGYFAAAGTDPGVLLAPLTILLAGLGVGARAFDGRNRQPGVGAKRPRGFESEANVPIAAYVAIPTGVAAAVIACAYDPQTTVSQVIRPGVAQAKKSGSPERARLLEAILAHGASAFADPGFKQSLLRRAGPPQGGLVSSRDLKPPEAIDVAAREDAGAWVAPWARERAPVSDALGLGRAICALDARGLFVVLAFRSLPSDAWMLEEYGVRVPQTAIPVMRGVPRTPPGAPLPVPAPIAIRRDSAGLPKEVVASPTAETLGEVAEFTVRRDPVTSRAEIIRH